ncbi:nucleotide sugar dehydrogenase [Shewanella algae]|uniref:nucleotide sugar dehydrogenase n=1 Tax=Shewanella algae TaxID=38313 RepID=UPI001AAD17F0|nr:nucleotide sugar dehydrogenase [Shewanella algae]MBO2670260.1 nucleotide sugar dehydrogenase [Shewanella algae]
MNVNKIAVIGLGYVGLPLAVEFGKKYETIGFDINKERVMQLRQGLDLTQECSKEELASSTRLTFSEDIDEIKNSNFYIVTVPTPVDKHFKPDLTPLLKASQMLGTVISKGDVIVYESTVYPGATEDDCIPEIERVSGLKFNEDFYAGYSPERINPGDKVNRLTTIKKITSGSTPEIAEVIDNLYGSIISAGTFKATSIRVAEAAKVIENTQRDVNIALMNEFAIMFNKMNINVSDVLDAAGTKWNFIKLSPGLVGGHCIGVDPYYLLQKANEYNYAPDMIRSAREINNSMAGFVSDQIVIGMVKRGMVIPNSSVLILGFTFKENCPDIRNTKIIDVYKSLVKYGIDVDVFDPVACPKEINQEYGIAVNNRLVSGKKYEVIALMVPHDIFINDSEIYEYLKSNGFVYDLKSKLKDFEDIDRVVL